MKNKNIDVNIKDNIHFLYLIMLKLFLNDFIFDFFWKKPIDYTTNNEIKQLLEK